MAAPLPSRYATWVFSNLMNHFAMSHPNCSLALQPKRPLGLHACAVLLEPCGPVAGTLTTEHVADGVNHGSRRQLGCAWRDFLGLRATFRYRHTQSALGWLLARRRISRLWQRLLLRPLDRGLQSWGSAMLGWCLSPMILQRG